MLDTPGRDPRLIPCSNSKISFYDLVEEHFSGVEKGYAISSPFRRLCSLMRKMQVKSYVVEQLDAHGELQEENEDIKIATKNKSHLYEIKKLTFFSHCPRSRSIADLKEEKLLCSCIIAKIAHTAPNEYFKQIDTNAPWLVAQNGKLYDSYIYEAIIRVPENSCLPKFAPTNYYTHVFRDFNVCLAIKKKKHIKFKLTGTYFCQQNDITHVCAHCAIRSALNSFPPQQYEKVTPRMINASLRINHKTEKSSIGSYNKTRAKGLRSDDMCRAIKKLKFHPMLMDFSKGAGTQYDYEKVIYPYLESGYPVILGVSTTEVLHVITLHGHTLNSDRWSPEARLDYGAYPIADYLSTTQWVDHFIGCDDNYGPILAISTDALKSVLSHRYNLNLKVEIAICITPWEVKRPAYEAEESANLWVTKVLLAIQKKNAYHVTNIKWFKRFYMARLNRKGKTVARTCLKRREEILEHYDAINIAPKDIEKISDKIPDTAWVIELSLPNLYTANKHKLGEVIVNANPKPKERNIHIARFPGFFAIGSGQGPILEVLTPCNLNSHVPLIREPAVNQNHIGW